MPSRTSLTTPLLLALALTGCAAPQAATTTTTATPAAAAHPAGTPAIRARVRSSAAFTRSEAALTPPQEQSRDRNCGIWGVPVLQSNGGFGRTDFVGRHGYFLEHSATDHIPIWVAERIDKNQIDDPLSADRPTWKAEPQLQPGLRAEDDDYKPFTNPQTGEYDRGHMCPNADFDTETLRAETFFLSNVVPQIKRNNQGIWASLEGRVRDWVKQRGTAFVITGPMFYDPKDDPSEPGFNPAQNDGVINYFVIGVANEVAVPTHIFKIVLAPVPGHPDQWDSIAVVLENRPYPSPYPFDANLRSIDWIEQRTGINFFPAMDADPAMEHRLEGSKAAHVW